MINYIKVIMYDEEHRNEKVVTMAIVKERAINVHELRRNMEQFFESCFKIYIKEFEKGGG